MVKWIYLKVIYDGYITPMGVRVSAPNAIQLIGAAVALQCVPLIVYQAQV